MGTSQSSTGPGGNTPLVPPWADDQPDQPLPAPEPARYSPFRRALGSFIQSGDTGTLHSALGHYSRKATGGSQIAARRMGAVTRAGASLYRTLIGASGPVLPPDSIIDLATLSGQPCKIAIDAISHALSGSNGDSSKIRSAMNYALVDALDGVAIFSPERITEEVIVNTMISYLTEAVFLQIVEDGGKAWTKAETPTQITQAENALREVVRVEVDKHMAPKLAGNARILTTSEVTNLQRDVIENVWRDWEAYQ